jgi:hypothetical protein
LPAAAEGRRAGLKRPDRKVWIRRRRGLCDPVASVLPRDARTCRAAAVPSVRFVLSVNLMPFVNFVLFAREPASLCEDHSPEH